jgi:hypothetical protein
MTRAAPIPKALLTSPPLLLLLLLLPPLLLMSVLAASLLHLHLLISARLFSGTSTRAADF